jgi:signal transduction histidine kinase
VASAQAGADPAWEEAGEVALYAGLPCLLLAVAGGWWLTRRALHPLQQLTAAAQTIHAGNLKQQLPVPPSNDEIATLTRVFNTMTARLDESFERIRQFTLNASHELKTPLTIMRSELETALHDGAAPEPEQQRAASLLDEVERLAHIVDGLTFLTRADAGLAAFKAEPIRVDELVRDAYAEAQVLAGSHDIQIVLDRCDEGVVVGDRHRLRQLLLILTDNAIKYNEAAGVVRLRLSSHPHQLELRVSNNGPGLQPHELPRAFDRFFRGQAAEANGSDGCGLGLSIARSIASAHGASIEMASEPGKLTMVTVRFRADTSSPALA